jgi:hypothetical protein
MANCHRLAWLAIVDICHSWIFGLPFLFPGMKFILQLVLLFYVDNVPVLLLICAYIDGKWDEVLVA